MATKSDTFKLYTPQRFNRTSRMRFFRDRRGRWAAHCGGSVSDSLAVMISQVCSLEWDVLRLEAREIKNGKLSSHDRIALAAWRRHLREALRLLGPRVAQDKPADINDLVRSIEAAKTGPTASVARAAA